jgi:hypothetical protein
VSKVALLFL